MQILNFKVQSSESKVKSFKSKDSKITFLKKAPVEVILKVKFMNE